MQCVTSFFQRVPEAKGLWLWRVPQLFEPRVVTQADAKLLDGPGRQEFAALAAESLNTLTSRGPEGDRWTPLANGSDGSQKWTAKAYVNYTGESMPVRINGPLTSGEEDKKLNLVIPGGHALVSTVVDAGLGKQRFARYFSSSIGTKGIVIVGFVGYEPQPRTSIPSLQGFSGSPRQQGPRIATRSREQKRKLHMLNDAYLRMDDEPFQCLIELLDIREAEMHTVFAMNQTKRRKLQVVFNLLAQCDDGLLALAEGVAEEDGEDEIGEQSPLVELPSQMSPSFSQSSQGSKSSSQGSTTPVSGGKKAAIVAMQLSDSGYVDASKGMKCFMGMKTLSPEGRKAPIMLGAQIC